MKITDFKTMARGNGIPCNGDLVETFINGEKFRAEFYIEYNFGIPCLMLAADSKIEKFVYGQWQEVEFKNDDDFNELLEKFNENIEK